MYAISAYTDPKTARMLLRTLHVVYPWAEIDDENIAIDSRKGQEFLIIQYGDGGHLQCIASDSLMIEMILWLYSGMIEDVQVEILL